MQQMLARTKMRVMEGSKAVAEIVKRCRPHVISAYPITPQTHIVEYLSQMVADGEIKRDGIPAQYVRVESEHSAASVCLGASATGARTYTATTSQGLLLMYEVLYNIAGMRLPVILTGVNRAISAPLNIWNDWQDTISARDAGWIQIYAEDVQEAVDLHLVAYRVGEDPDVLLPVMVCMDGFLLTHTYEPVEIPGQEEVDAFLPDFKPKYYLTVEAPVTMGAFCEPDKYMEARYMLWEALEGSREVLRRRMADFRTKFGRLQGDLVETYNIEGARTVLVSMGTLVSTLREVSERQAEKGNRVGVLKIRCHRPFPAQEIIQAISGAENVIVFEKAVSLGLGSILGNEIKSLFAGEPKSPKFSLIIAGLGGRDVPASSVEKVLKRAECQRLDLEFLDLKHELLGGEQNA